MEEEKISENEENSEGMYSYKSDNDNNNNNNINNQQQNDIDNNNNDNDQNIGTAIRRSLPDSKIQVKPSQYSISKNDIYQSGKINPQNNYYQSGRISPNMTKNLSSQYRGSLASIELPEDSYLHWSFVLIYIILETILIILIAVLFKWDKRNHPIYSCIDFNITQRILNDENFSNQADILNSIEQNETNTNITINNITDDIYLSTEKELNTYYGLFRDINIMAFVGFGMFHTLTKGNSWSSIAFNILSIVLCFQISLFFNLIFENAFKESWSKGFLNFKTFIEAIYNSCAILVSIGGVIGKISHVQYLVLIICESILCSLNFKLCDEKMKVIDTGGGLYVHTFGAVFGFAIFLVLFRSKKKRARLTYCNFNHLSNYLSSITCFIGVLFILNYFPSFNAGLALSDDGRYRAVINTYFSIIGSIILSFMTSGYLHQGKFVYEHILFSSFSGGVIISSFCSVCIDHWAALLIGMVCGIITIFLLEYLSQVFNQYNYNDIYNILIVHAIPGVLSGFISAMFIGGIENRNNNYRYILLKDLERNGNSQAGVQVGAIFVTLALAFAGGITSGFLVKVSRCGKIKNYFDDTEFFANNETNENGYNDNITDINDHQPSFMDDNIK